MRNVQSSSLCHLRSVMRLKVKDWRPRNEEQWRALAKTVELVMGSRAAGLNASDRTVELETCIIIANRGASCTSGSYEYCSMVLVNVGRRQSTPAGFGQRQMTDGQTV